jgi:hypothetical protein
MTADAFVARLLRFAAELWFEEHTPGELEPYSSFNNPFLIEAERQFLKARGDDPRSPS